MRYRQTGPHYFLVSPQVSIGVPHPQSEPRADGRRAAAGIFPERARKVGMVAFSRRRLLLFNGGDYIS